MKAMYCPPVIIRSIFREFHWTTSSGKVLLTFDDGPIPETTGTLLNELDKLNIKCTFFCVGNNVKNNRAIAKEILNAGHTIANHTYNHRKIAFKPVDIQRVEIEQCCKIIEDVTGAAVRYFRPPHGRIDFKLSKVLSEARLQGVLWSLLTLDYKNNLNIVKFTVEKYLKNNSIVVLHDSLKSKDIIIDSIRFIAEEVKKKGFEFGDAEECLK